MDEPGKKLSPFAPTPARIMLLCFGVILVLIAISMARGGMSGYQELREARDATIAAPAEPASTTAP